MKVIKITDEQRNYLSLHMKDIESLIIMDDVQRVLDRIDDEIINNMLGNNDEPDENGITLQRIYDEIYSQN